MNLLFKLVSILLRYPNRELISMIPELREKIDTSLILRRYKLSLNQFLDYLESHNLIYLQMNYVRYFDMNSAQALYLFEHVHGEDRNRGMAMVDLTEEYKQHGLTISVNELPDYLPLVLEFLSEIESETAKAILADAVSVIHHIGEKLKESENPYAALFTIIVDVSPCKPQKLIDPPLHNMDQAIDLFGITHEGIEPLLTPSQTPCMRHPVERF